MENNSEIADFYSHRCIFLTGATGFLGLTTVEKLLRSCPDISKLYVLIRPKRDSDIHSRMAELLESPLFNKIRKENPLCFNKITPIAGDIRKPELGISDEDVAMLCENVTIVIHSAATIKFDEKLKIAIETNLCGAQNMVRLCKKMNKLVALVHVSTAYANCEDKQVIESIRPSKFDPHGIIEFSNLLDDNTVEKITPVLVGNKPNTYIFTKDLTENLLKKERDNLPICIVRPSIILATHKEPVSGWLNSLNGATGTLTAYGKGILRSWPFPTDKIADIIPSDFVSNLIIATAWDIAKTKPNYIKVYHCCTGPTNPLRWGELMTFTFRSFRKNPFNDILWVPGAIFYRSHLLNWPIDVIVHHIPAYLIDLAAQFAGKKPIMKKIHQKLKKANEVFEFFISREWDFENINMPNLYERMCPKDKLIFNLNLRDIDWSDYIENYCLGMRKYILKEDSDSLPLARKKLVKLVWIDKFIKIFFILFFSVLSFKAFY